MHKEDNAIPLAPSATDLGLKKWPPHPLCVVMMITVLASSLSRVTRMYIHTPVHILGLYSVGILVQQNDTWN